ncbi:periplasmic nitrate reductase chaperone NapD [Cribrihabitans marinus]|uniref:Chaperone NapD n=1 Tax=Cribrihabitans marinus TaxID=1227549 RepID=A0A1H6WF02_9RHOB|nr:chaperone NapD [Cribrihabitans marinus]GGH24810.1 hypothetical protein GCM10010973_11550 [Cribrihabitans marinus]SEJ10895.1 periplasmic nitrate reductase chaperone NapD [Cribrihabitans marinus]
MNICGCLVHVTPDAVTRVAEQMNAIEGVEVHATSEDGHLVVVVEDTPNESASNLIMSLHQIPGVLSLTLNYHHFEDPSQQAPDTALQPEN